MVFVLGWPKRLLMSCTEQRAHKLLEYGLAVSHKRALFTIRLKARTVEDSALQPFETHFDTGSKVTGITIIWEPPHDPKGIIFEESVHKAKIKGQSDTRRAFGRVRTNRIDNLVLACAPGNLRKNNRREAKCSSPGIRLQPKKPLKDLVLTNASQWRLSQLKVNQLPLKAHREAAASATKGSQIFNRTQRRFPVRRPKYIGTRHKNSGDPRPLSTLSRGLIVPNSTLVAAE